ncbi:MAG: helix-turn-helix transcriptional regulator [Alistipes sp.]|nr:helix-turn-helix transcriptional regulator [Alistipes sp.]
MKDRSIVPDEENPIGAIFSKFPELNGRQVARSMNINETLFQNYINGRKRPSFERIRDIENFLHTLGEDLMKIRL